MVTASPPATCRVTKPPEAGETTPISFTIVTSVAAIAASTAFPPSAATRTPASAAAAFGAATATLG